MLKHLRGGFTLTELLVVIAVTGVLLALLLPAVQQAREAARRTRCVNNLHQIGLALHHYHDGRGRFPPGVSSPQSGDPYPWLSWQTRLLPYIEQEPMWQSALAAYKVESSPFVDPPHTALDEVMPVYDCPSDTRSLSPQKTYRDLRVALTSYLGVIGTNVDRPDGVLFRDSRVAFKDVTDGTSNTLLVGERPASADCWFGWWYAGQGQRNTGSLDMVLGVREINLGGDYITQCPPGPYHFQNGHVDQQPDAFHFWSLHPDGANFLFVDASVHFLTYSADDLLPALATRSGGETVSAP